MSLGAVALLPATAGAASEEVEFHSAILIHEERAGPNTLLVIRTSGGHQALGDRVLAWAGHQQAKAHEEASPDELSSWVIARKSSHGSGGPLLHLMRTRLERKGVVRAHAIFQPGGADVGKVASFKITGYRVPAPARY